MTDMYQFHRDLREHRRAATQNGSIAILDVGTGKIACLILRFDRNFGSGDAAVSVPFASRLGFRVIGAATTRSRGIRAGEVENMPETECAIRTVVQAAQKMAKTRVDHAIISFAGAAPRSYGLFGQAEVENPVVEESDVSRCLNNCDMPDFGLGREILHAQPVNFALDGASGLTDPRGQVGEKLATDMHLLTIDEKALYDLMYCVKRCDLEVAGLASSVYTSGLSSLVEDEQNLGAACIDFGAGTTSISIFCKKQMIFADSVKIGGEHITSDISMGLQIPMPLAERIKNLYGGAVATGIDIREMIDLGGETGDWEHDRRQVSRSELIGIIRPRVEEVLDEVRARMDGAGSNICQVVRWF